MLKILLRLQIKSRTIDLNSRGLRQVLNQIKSEYDTNYLTNPANFDEIKSNIINRKGVGNIELVHDLVHQLNQTSDTTIRETLQKQLNVALKTIPNSTHPDVANYDDKPKEVETIGSKRNFAFKSKSFADLCSKLNILRTSDLGNFNGTRSYYLMKELAELVSSVAIPFDRLTAKLNDFYSRKMHWYDTQSIHFRWMASNWFQFRKFFHLKWLKAAAWKHLANGIRYVGSRNCIDLCPQLPKEIIETLNRRTRRLSVLQLTFNFIPPGLQNRSRQSMSIWYIGNGSSRLFRRKKISNRNASY